MWHCEEEESVFAYPGLKEREMERFTLCLDTGQQDLSREIKGSHGDIYEHHFLLGFCAVCL